MCGLVPAAAYRKTQEERGKLSQAPVSKREAGLDESGNSAYPGCRRYENQEIRGPESRLWRERAKDMVSVLLLLWKRSQNIHPQRALSPGLTHPDHHAEVHANVSILQMKKRGAQRGCFK